MPQFRNNPGDPEPRLSRKPSPEEYQALRQWRSRNVLMEAEQATQSAAQQGPPPRLPPSAHGAYDGFMGKIAMVMDALSGNLK